MIPSKTLALSTWSTRNERITIEWVGRAYPLDVARHALALQGENRELFSNSECRGRM
jgi:hypothetical protein